MLYVLVDSFFTEITHGWVIFVENEPMKRESDTKCCSPQGHLSHAGSEFLQQPIKLTHHVRTQLRNTDSNTADHRRKWIPKERASCEHRPPSHGMRGRCLLLRAAFHVAVRGSTGRAACAAGFYVT